MFKEKPKKENPEQKKIQLMLSKMSARLLKKQAKCDDKAYADMCKAELEKRGEK
jgi:hypothetical protein